MDLRWNNTELMVIRCGEYSTQRTRDSTANVILRAMIPERLLAAAALRHRLGHR